MKYTYSILIQENPTIYHIWYLYSQINHPGDLLPDIIATEISDLTTQLNIKDQISLIDTEDMHHILLNTIRITAVSKHRQGETGYLETSDDIKVHNLLLEFHNNQDKTKSVDHINCNRLDNRRSNLRIATLSTQMRNRKCAKQPQSGHRGITEHGNKYDVCFVYNKKRYREYFYDLQDAIKWRQQKMKEVIPAEELLEWQDIEPITVNNLKIDTQL